MSDQMPEIPQGFEGQAPPDAEEYVPNNTPVAGESEISESPELTFESTGNDNDSDKSGGINPAWTPALENIPKEFHQFLIPEFKKWDENYNKVQSQYSSYKPLVENNVPYGMVQQSLQLAQALNADPRAVYEELGRRYGFSGQGQNQVDENEDDEEDNSQEYEVDESGYDPTKDPRLQPYFEQQRMVTENLLARQQAEADREAEREIQNAWMELEKTNGKPFNEDEQKEILQRSLWISDQTGKEPDLREGYKNYTEFVSKIRGQRANNPAPDVLGGNGGLPAQRRGITSDMSDDQRQSYIAEQVALLNKNQ